MTDHFQYPPDLFNLLVDVIPLLCRSKRDVVLFFQGAGVVEGDYGEFVAALASEPKSINKYQISREILSKVNARGDSGLQVRREILKRVTEFENFDTCWESDRLKAKGLVSEIRRAVHVRDSFTRMQMERDESKAAERRQRELAAQKMVQRKERIAGVGREISALFALEDKPHERGKHLERTLNNLFAAYEVGVREDFQRRDPDSSIVLEQVDGVIELGGRLHLVEMKWLKQPVGVAEFGPHLVRVFGRAGVDGIFISASGYTEPVVKQCADFLNQRVNFLCSLREIVLLLHREGDLIDILTRKSQAAMLDKNPYLEILT